MVMTDSDLKYVFIVLFPIKNKAEQFIGALRSDFQDLATPARSLETKHC
jgi:hypothetical protein